MTMPTARMVDLGGQMKRPRIVGVSLGALALTGAALLGTAAPANAAWSDCPAGALCAYLDPNGGRDPGTVYGDNRNLLQYNKFNNAESLYNHGNNCDVVVFSGLNYSGFAENITRGTAVYNLYSDQNGRYRPLYHNVASNDWCR
jgi:hypothetical protein